MSEFFDWTNEESCLAAVKLRHQRLVNLMTLLMKLKNSLDGYRNKRATKHFPAIYIDVARVILGNINFHEFIKTYALGPDSESLLYVILEDYGMKRKFSDQGFIQCYLDVIHSVDELSYLHPWLFIDEPDV